jgi:molybdopterin converting factor small subunit
VKVTVRLYAMLRELGPGRTGEIELDVPDGTSVAQLMAQLGLPSGLVRKVFVGGIARDDAHVLRPGDEVGLFPPIAGGC